MSISGMPQAGKSDDLENMSISGHMSISGLVSLVRQLLGRVEALEAEITVLKAENASLREQLRAAKRPGAPFSKRPGSGAPKKPGRHRGKGRFERRAEPVPGPAEARLRRTPLDCPDCPQCGARLEVTESVATVEDTPAEPVRIIRRFHVEHGTCAVCGWSGRGRHADLAPGQHGATAHRAGPRIMARALTLHYLHLCKVPAVIRAATGIGPSPSALTQAAAALCAPGAALGTAYDGLWEEVRTSPVVNTGDTGWRIGGATAFLMGFFTPLLVVFQIRWRHRHQEVVEMLGARFTGLLGTDRATSYEAGALDSTGQQKCLSHLLKNLSVVEETRTGRAKAFTKELKATLRGAVIARKVSHCSKNERGARTYEIMKSITATLTLRGHQVSSVFAGMISGRPMPGAAAR